jgi:hypothetical protein
MTFDKEKENKLSKEQITHKGPKVYPWFFRIRK